MSKGKGGKGGCGCGGKGGQPQQTLMSTTTAEQQQQSSSAAAFGGYTDGPLAGFSQYLSTTETLQTMSSSSRSAAAGDLVGGGGYSPAAVPADPWQPTGPEHFSIADPWQTYAQVAKSPGVAQQTSNQSSTPTFMSIAQQLAQASHGPPGLRTAASSSWIRLLLPHG